jgi:hypothetical protein
VKEPGVAIDDLLDGGNRRVIVGGGVDTDPILGGIYPDYFLSRYGTANVGPETANPWDGSQFTTGLGRDPDGFIV